LHVTRKAWDDPDFDWQHTAACCFAQRGIILIAMQNSALAEKVASQTVLFNSAALIDWNIDKHYLQWIAEKGINVVNTHYIEKGDARSLAQCLARVAGMMPFSNRSFRLCTTYLSNPPENTPELECIFAELVQQEALLLQPFQHILSEGEISLMVIDGQFSHAIRKTPQGDFRVQMIMVVVCTHTATIVEQQFAEQAVAAVPFDVLYARVDIIRDNTGKLAIMELEMIEPELFFRYKPEAADKLAGLIRRLAQL
jgi:hypothetical protein